MLTEAAGILLGLPCGCPPDSWVLDHLPSSHAGLTRCWVPRAHCGQGLRDRVPRTSAVSQQRTDPEGPGYNKQGPEAFGAAEVSEAFRRPSLEAV